MPRMNPTNPVVARARRMVRDAVRRGMSSMRIASACGVDLSTVFRWRRGVGPSVNTADRVVKALRRKAAS
jgi:transposase-like protein